MFPLTPFSPIHSEAVVETSPACATLWLKEIINDEDRRPRLYRRAREVVVPAVLSEIGLDRRPTRSD